MSAKKPRLFIGSSTEALDEARAVHQCLDYDAEVTQWPHGTFKPSKGNLENLENSLGNYDFAVFLFTPDDLTKIRASEQSVTRDNVIFETGLFIGKLGTERVFLIQPRGIPQFHLPTDLAGITTLDYDPKRSDGNLNAALDPACNPIRNALKKWRTLEDSRLIETSNHLVVNPHYKLDLAVLDGKWANLDDLITSETILIVTGPGVISELLDRPTAAILRDEIDKRGKNKPGRRGVVISDLEWARYERGKELLTIVIGSEKANVLTKSVLEEKDLIKWDFADGVHALYMKRYSDGVHGPRLIHELKPMVALWGYTAKATLQAVRYYIERPDGLPKLLKDNWL